MGFKSFFLLGFQLIVHVLRKLAFWLPRRGAAQFLENYAPDGIAPTTEAEGDLILAWLNCSNCGLCEAVCPLEGVPAAPGQLSFAQLAYAGWRDLTAHAVIAKSAANLATCESCGACEAICPERIPLRALAESVARAG